MKSGSALLFFALIVVASSVNAQGLKRYYIASDSEAEIRAAVQSEGGDHIRDFKYFKGFAANLPDAAVDNLKRRFGDSLKIELDPEVSANGKPGSTPPPQPVQNNPWGISAVKAPDAWSLSRGAGVTVCVVDTGVDASHPDLAANIAGGENFVVIKGSLNSAKWADDNGHGTHVSGTIAALDNSIGVVGVAPDAKIFAVKVLNNRGNGYLTDVADGIRACVDHGGAQVINMSLGSASGASYMESAVTYAVSKGAIVVAAAGNESGPVSYPAKYANVIAVSAVDSSMRLASFSNFGPEVDFAAPGVNILSTAKGGGYVAHNGTSMASPHVAGVAALKVSSGSIGLIGADIGLPPEQQGAGFIDALATVQFQAP